MIALALVFALLIGLLLLVVEPIAMALIWRDEIVVRIAWYRFAYHRRRAHKKRGETW